MRCERWPVDPERPDPRTLERAGAWLRAGALVGFPTETVYGLGAAAGDTAAVARIYAVKGRPADNPLIVHVADPSWLGRVATAVPQPARLLADTFWPGPLTLVVPGRDATVAVRVPAHPVALALIAAADRPVAAPSANRSGRPSPTQAEHVLEDLGEGIDLVLDAGPTPLGVESTVVDATERPLRLLRPGGLARGDIEAVLGETLLPPDPRRPARSPGQRHRHYAPRAPLELFEPGQADQLLRAAWRLAPERRVGVLLAEPRPLPPQVVVEVLGPRADPVAWARALFGALRRLDAQGVEVILAEGPDPVGVGEAVWDRLRRARARGGEDRA